VVVTVFVRGISRVNKQLSRRQLASLANEQLPFAAAAAGRRCTAAAQNSSPLSSRNSVDYNGNRSGS